MQTVGDIITIVFLRVPQWLLKHRIFLLVIVIAIVIGIGVNAFHKHTADSSVSSEIPAYQKTAPPSNFIGKTSSRVYYINAYSDDGVGKTTLTDFYSYEGDKWVKQPYPLPLKSSQIQISRR